MQFPKWPIYGERELELLREVLDSDQWGGFHPMVPRLEREFAAHQHCRHGIGAANGSVTLEVILQAAGGRPGDEVIVPAISFVSTASAVSRAGATPVFVDMDRDTFQICPERAEAAITPLTKGIIVTHFGGAFADIERFTAMAEERGMFLIEDAAHAQGSEWNGRRAGSFGRAASFSFQNGKVITAGEGGMITTNDDELAGRMRSIVNMGRRPGFSFYHHFEVASNFRLSGLHAAVLVAQLERLSGQIERRARNAAAIIGALRDVEGIMWQKFAPQVNRNSWYLMIGRIDEAKLGATRDEFHRALTAQGVPCTPFYPHALYANPGFADVPHRVEPCPNAEAALRDSFWLPHRALLGDDETTREVAAAIAAVGRRALVA